MDDPCPQTDDLFLNILYILHTNYLLRTDHLHPNWLFIPRGDQSPYELPIPVWMTPCTDDISPYGYPIPVTEPSYDPGSCSNTVLSFNCAEHWIQIPLWIRLHPLDSTLLSLFSKGRKITREYLRRQQHMNDKKNCVMFWPQLDFRFDLSRVKSTSTDIQRISCRGEIGESILLEIGKMGVHKLRIYPHPR